MHDKLLAYKIAIGLIPGIGSVLAKKLIAYTGSVEAVFNEKKVNLLKIPGIGEHLADEIVKSNLMHIAENELQFIEKYNLSTFFYLDETYPHRLKQCFDAPLLLFQKGTIDYNVAKIIAIVGTRSATSEGRDFTYKFVEEISLRHPETIIISGLAYGIDIYAHRASLKYGLKTVAAIAHGLDTIYPAIHRKDATEIAETGALVTEFLSKTALIRQNFLKRNRIIAGLADATIVVESGITGGALVTADIAQSYNREVFAVPGRVTDKCSLGCNKLIKSNKAALIENAEDFEYLMNWQSGTKKKPVQQLLFTNLNEEEEIVLNVLRKEDKLPFDIITVRANLPVAKVSALLLSLEFAGYVKSLPGKIYALGQ